MLAQLGTIRFQYLTAPHTWDSEHEWTWADVTRIEGKPASQAIAPGLVTHSIAGLLDAAFCNVPTEVDALKGIGDGMVAVPFFLGDGTFVSNVTMRRLSISRKVMTRTGADESVEFTAELSEYVATEPSKEGRKWD